MNKDRSGGGERLLKKDGSANISIIGMRRPLGSDLYHYLNSASWPALFGAIMVLYIVVNCLFAFLYLLEPQGVENMGGGFGPAFFFSVQTLSTVGYGHMSPISPYVNTIVTIEAFSGMILNAVVTGLLFSKFSRPRAKVLFSEVAILGDHMGTPHLMIRMANRRRNQIIQAQTTVTFSRDELDGRGEHFRRFYTLPLTRSSTSLFALSWTVFHPINEDSPLYGMNHFALRDSRANIVVTVVGIDDTLSQSVHARYSYEASEVIWGARYRDILNVRGPGPRSIDYRLFHDYERDPGFKLPPLSNKKGST